MTLSGTYLRDLALLTLRSPAQAGQQILALKLEREILWTGFALAVVLNTLMFTLQQYLIPAPEDTPAIFTSQTAYFAMVAGGQVLFIYALYLRLQMADLFSNQRHLHRVVQLNRTQTLNSGQHLIDPIQVLTDTGRQV